MKLFAFDRSMRRVDADGRLHVDVSNISKAIVNGYLGSEIPGSEALGLQPDKIYQLLRCPVEMAKAAPTFNNLPLLSRHVDGGQSAATPVKDLIIGSTGTDASFDAPYLRNSLVVWDAIAIAGINTKEQCELSSSYRYTPVMTPGVYEGVAYDGVMTQIIGNHVAVVEIGRAGPDVVVGDSQLIVPKPPELITMKLSRTAVAVHAAIVAYIAPRLAADAAIGDTKAFVRGVTSATFANDQARIITEVTKRFDGVKSDELGRVLKLAADSTEDDTDPKVAKDEDEQRDDESDEDYKKRMDAKKSATANDGDDDKDDKEKDKKAMDAAIKSGVAAATLRMTAARNAEREVRPVIGEVLAQDSAEAVYRLALDHLKVDVTGVDPSAYGAMFRLAAAKNAEAALPSPRLALDAAHATDFAARFPTAGNLKRSI